MMNTAEDLKCVEIDSHSALATTRIVHELIRLINGCQNHEFSSTTFPVNEQSHMPAAQMALYPPSIMSGAYLKTLINRVPVLEYSCPWCNGHTPIRNDYLSALYLAL
jgi:hypothetical protein